MILKILQGKKHPLLPFMKKRILPQLLPLKSINLTPRKSSRCKMI